MRSFRTMGFVCLGFAMPGAAWAQDHGGGHHADCPADAVATPILSVADFDGNGTVDADDLDLVNRQRKAEYIAFYDRDADGDLDAQDVAATARDMGASSTALDQELADLFWATEKYRNQAAAIDDGFIPFTPAFAGHGYHYAKHYESGDLDYTFEADNPEGLNYDENGELWAVFHYAGANPDPANGPGWNPFAMAPAGYTGHHDMWHHHAGACFIGLDYDDPEMDSDNLGFHECIGPGQCGMMAYMSGTSDFRWNPKFYMLHVWLYKLNPCGLFAGEHPDIMSDATEPHSASCDVTDEVAGSPYTYTPFQQFCAWMDQVGAAPATLCF